MAFSLLTYFSVLMMITGHSTLVFIFNSTFCPFMSHITSSSPAEPRFESAVKRQKVLLRSCSVIVIGTSTAFMKFPGKLWKQVGVLQNGCCSWKPPLCWHPCLCVENVFMLTAKCAPFHLWALTFCLWVSQCISNYIRLVSCYTVLLEQIWSSIELQELGFSLG